MPAAWRAEPQCRDSALLSATKQADGAASSLALRNTASHRLYLRRAGGGGHDGVAAIDEAGRPELEEDGIQFSVPGVDGK